MKLIKFRDPILDSPIRYCIGSAEEFSKYCFEELGYEDDDPAYGREGMVATLQCRNTGLMLFLVWVSEENIPIIAHETLHLVYKVLKHCNIPTGRSNEEVIAYRLEYYMKKVLKKLKK